MLKRVYIHNYKSFQNFELKFDDFGSSLFLGKNGSGKSSLVEVFKIFQDIGRGIAQLDTLIKKEDFNILNSELPMILEINVLLQEKLYNYRINIDFTKDIVKPRVLSEELYCDNEILLDRKQNELSNSILPLSFPFYQLILPNMNLGIDFKEWLSKILVISPIPALIHNESNQKDDLLDYYCINTSNWISNLLSQFPKSYLYIHEYLSTIFSDLEEITNKKTSETSHKLEFVFSYNQIKQKMAFSQLSYGERIFVLWSAILASVKLDQISLCVWDEPENYISLLEIQHYFNTLKQTFNDKAQFVATTHNPETMRMFSSEDIFILFRKHHLEPVRLQAVTDLNIENDIAEMIKAGLVEL